MYTEFNVYQYGFIIKSSPLIVGIAGEKRRKRRRAGGRRELKVPTTENKLLLKINMKILERALVKLIPF